jgi:hypothetical protein
MNSTELEQALKVKWFCRSGYTTIMDLAQLRKKALFHTRQYGEYLAESSKLKDWCLMPHKLISKWKILQK